MLLFTNASIIRSLEAGVKELNRIVPGEGNRMDLFVFSLSDLLESRCGYKRYLLSNAMELAVVLCVKALARESRWFGRISDRHLAMRRSPLESTRSVKDFDIGIVLVLEF